LAVLQPIWLEKPETARRLRQRLRTVFDWTIAARHRREANPLAGIEKALPRQADRATHHAALPWAELPALMARLAEAGGSGALALRFCILTAARSGEVRGARWEEIDAADPEEGDSFREGLVLRFMAPESHFSAGDWPLLRTCAFRAPRSGVSGLRDAS
ncbi:tyrosine-type recombinase/integrase, partial [Paralimibaculum aggregatum]|uniref:tyrosine-type recombinase/integrase n=1 Tax=Paralimibaculum aggregatum TaxID=3036245 RepID=UPI002552F591